MDANLAGFSLSSPSSWSWQTIVLVTLIIAACLSPYAVRQMRKIRGPVLTGTAQVLSLRQFGSVGEYGSQQICRMRLRVTIPGREPYDVTVWRNIAAWNVGAVARGSTLAVDVSAKNPKKVQIGRSQRPQIIVNTMPAGWSGTPPPTVSEQADAYSTQTAGSASVISAAELLASGQRVPGVLKSFAATGTTPRGLGRTASRPELIDAPHHILEVELQFPNLAPVIGRAVQPVPLTQVSRLAIGLKLDCAVDPADPTHRFVVDWAG